jgi:hypothetical protein
MGKYVSDKVINLYTRTTHSNLSSELALNTRISANLTL